jgi:YD repeat-containing protein
MKLALYSLGICLIGSACGGSAAATAPTAATGAASTPQTCRTYPTAATDVETNAAAVPPFTLTNTYTNVFNPATSQLVRTGTVRSSTGCSGPFTITTTWPSTAAFVAEVAVVPPLTRASRIERSASACGTGNTVTFTYDAQNKVTQLVDKSSTTTYTAWDSFGRPAAGTITGGPLPFSITITYDNAARTLRQTFLIGSNPPAPTLTTFDADGNLIGLSDLTTGTNTVTTIASTARVCG